MSGSAIRGIIDRMLQRLALVAGGLVIAAACATRPRPTAESVARAANPRAVVEGRVVDADGEPLAGVSVRGLPREKEVGWSPPSVTDALGRFRLELVAPGEYGFLAWLDGVTVVGPRKDDPSRVVVHLAPGDHRTGIELVFRREEWERARRSAPPH
jgi:hypothetical protein